MMSVGNTVAICKGKAQGTGHLNEDEEVPISRRME